MRQNEREVTFAKSRCEGYVVRIDEERLFRLKRRRNDTQGIALSVSEKRNKVVRVLIAQPNKEGL